LPRDVVLSGADNVRNFLGWKRHRFLKIWDSEKRPKFVAI